MENVKKGIAVAGSVLVDKIYTISAYPESGQLTQIHSIQKAVGGCVPNVALDLKKLSPDLSVYAVGPVGQDEDGAFVTQVLKQGGVDTDCLTALPESTSFTDVMSVQTNFSAPYFFAAQAVLYVPNTLFFIASQGLSSIRGTCL